MDPGGASGKPMLQVGGVQDAVTDPAPGDVVVTGQESVHAVPAATTAGCEAVQVRGILLRTIPPSVLGRELFPITSVTVAKTVSEVPLETAKEFCSDPGWPTSRIMFWMGQVSKKVRSLPGGGCTKEVLLTPLAVA